MSHPATWIRSISETDPCLAAPNRRSRSGDRLSKVRAEVGTSSSPANRSWRPRLRPRRTFILSESPAISHLSAALAK
jgi:hypothetical protein